MRELTPEQARWLQQRAMELYHLQKPPDDPNVIYPKKILGGCYVVAIDELTAKPGSVEHCLGLVYPAAGFATKTEGCEWRSRPLRAEKQGHWCSHPDFDGECPLGR